MKKALASFLALIMVFAFSAAALMLTASAATAAVYVSDGGTGDGSSAASPLGSLTAAYEKIAATGGTVYLVGKVTVEQTAVNSNSKGGFTEPEHAKQITVTSSGAKATLFFDIDKATEYLLSGPTVFENIIIDGTDTNTDNLWFLARGNHLTMGENIEMADAPVGAAPITGTGVYVAGITRIGDEYDGCMTDEAWLTIKSGNFYYLCATTMFVTTDSGIPYTGTAYMELYEGCASYEITCGTAGGSNQADWQGTTILSVYGKITNYNYFFTGVNYATASANGTCVMILNKGGMFDLLGMPKKAVGLAKVLNVNVFYNASDDDAVAYKDIWDAATLTRSGSAKTIEILDKYTGATVPTRADVTPAEVGGSTPAVTTSAPAASTATAATTAGGSSASPITLDSSALIIAFAVAAAAVSVVLISKKKSCR